MTKNGIKETLARIDERTDNMEKQISAIFRKLDNKMDSETFYWIGGIIITILITTFTIINKIN